MKKKSVKLIEKIVVIFILLLLIITGITSMIFI